MGDEVDHPDHYNRHPSGVECIDIVEHMSFNTGSAVKLIWRSGLKEDVPTIQDLRKAIWYLGREVERLAREGDPKYVDGFCPRCNRKLEAGEMFINCCPEHNQFVCKKCRDELHPGTGPQDPGHKVAHGG